MDALEPAEDQLPVVPPSEDQQPSQPPAGHETVIKFVLSGPIFADQTPDGPVVQVESIDEASGLYARVSALERSLADAESRLVSMSKALAEALAFSSHIARPASAPYVSAAPAVVPDDVPVRRQVGSVAPPDLLAIGAGLAPAAVVVADHDVDPVADPVVAALSEVAPSDPVEVAPKARGLRRMISVLKPN
jgi:hypothetical protein